VVAALASRHAGIVERDIFFKLGGDQDSAFAALEAAVKPLAPYVKVGHKVCV
jgi:hypothetical protein